MACSWGSGWIKEMLMQYVVREMQDRCNVEKQEEALLEKASAYVISKDITMGCEGSDKD